MTRNTIVALLLEDEPIIAIDIEQELASAGFAVSTVVSCLDAEHWLDVQRPDVAIVDIMLRDGTPSDVVEKLSAAKIPFIVHSGDIASMHANSPFMGGLWVNKPAAAHEILHAAQALLNG